LVIPATLKIRFPEIIVYNFINQKMHVMKKLILISFAGLLFASCDNQATETKESPKDSTAPAPVAMNYPYTIKKPDNWEIGSPQNTMTALTSLKAFEDGNVAESMKDWTDSVHLQFDAMDTTMAKDSALAMFTKVRNGYKSFSAKMDDWESVISKDKTEEWVTLWYRQSWEDMKGKKDSADIIDDMMFKNGKIARLDEYTRKLH
jgi:hypothetical protein